jgi:hypothetical protein
MSLGDLRWRLGSASQPGKKRNGTPRGPRNQPSVFHSAQLSKIFPRLSVNYRPFLLPIREKDVRKMAR